MSAIKKNLQKFRLYLIGKPKMQYLIGFLGLMDFIFARQIKKDILNKLFFLTNFNQGHRIEIAKKVMENDEMKQIIDLRLTQQINMDEFATYPASTLGFQYYLFLKNNQIPPFAYPIKYLKKCDAYTYIILRIVSTHDLYHVLLGAGCDYLGEGVVASFTIAQLPFYPMPCIHIGAGFIRYSLETKVNFDEVIPTLYKGSLIGKKAKQLFCVDWNNYWKFNVESIRKEFNIEPLDIL